MHTYHICMADFFGSLNLSKCREGEMGMHSNAWHINLESEAYQHASQIPFFSNSVYIVTLKYGLRSRRQNRL